MIFNMLHYIFNKAGFAVLSGKKDLNAENTLSVSQRTAENFSLINCLGKMSDNHLYYY